MKKTVLLSFIMLLGVVKVWCQSVNVLHQYGIGPVFLGSLFREGVSVKHLHSPGSFGIAAPSMVDGELIEFDGRIYQTKSNGETKPAPDSLKVPFGMFCLFKADTSIIVKAVSQQEMEQAINDYIKNSNGIYAIRISGTFAGIKTRAFHKVNQEPFPPISEIQAAQQVFDYHDLKGTMFGYRMPAFMSGISGTGFHFHFLSDDRQKGGHVLTYDLGLVRVEIALIKQVALTVPDDPAFNKYQILNTK